MSSSNNVLDTGGHFCITAGSVVNAGVGGSFHWDILRGRHVCSNQGKRTNDPDNEMGTSLSLAGATICQCHQKTSLQVDSSSPLYHLSVVTTTSDPFRLATTSAPAGRRRSREHRQIVLPHKCSLGILADFPCFLLCSQGRERRRDNRGRNHPRVLSRFHFFAAKANEDESSMVGEGLTFALDSDFGEET